MSILEGVIIGAGGGIAAGLFIWLLNWGREKWTERNHKNRVYAWLDKQTRQHKRLTVGAGLKDPRWKLTIEIASYTNLTPDRVRYICSIHDAIRPMKRNDLFKGESLEEKWAIREFVDS